MFSMLCASGLEFEEKLRQAAGERAKVERVQTSGAVLNENNLKYAEAVAKRYDSSLSALANHKRSCTLCSKA
jgi:hypothetical protein